MEEYSDRTPADIARYPMVPIRDVVIFPFTKVAFKIGRPGSVRALEMALASDRTIFLSTQHDATVAAFQLLAATGQLRASSLALDAPLYDPSVHYNENANRWFGLGPNTSTGYILP